LTLFDSCPPSYLFDCKCCRGVLLSGQWPPPPTFWQKDPMLRLRGYAPTSFLLDTLSPRIRAPFFCCFYSFPTLSAVFFSYRRPWATLTLFFLIRCFFPPLVFFKNAHVPHLLRFPYFGHHFSLIHSFKVLARLIYFPFRRPWSLLPPQIPTIHPGQRLITSVTQLHALSSSLRFSFFFDFSLGSRLPHFFTYSPPRAAPGPVRPAMKTISVFFTPVSLFKVDLHPKGR